MEATHTRWTFTVDDYHQMAAAGILHEDARVELIEGEIVAMSPIGARHVRCVTLLNSLLSAATGNTGVVNVQSPVRLGDLSELEPDLTVLLQPPDAAVPVGADDVLLVVEVSDTTLSYDREVKMPLYSRANISEVWLVDLVNRILWRYVDPRPGGYRLVERFDSGDRITSELSPTLTISLDINAVFE